MRHARYFAFGLLTIAVPLTPIAVAHGLFGDAGLAGGFYISLAIAFFVYVLGRLVSAFFGPQPHSDYECPWDL